MINNFLTLDVEEWFDAEIPRRKLSTFPEKTNIENQVDLFLDLCNKLEIKSTCFIVGKLAEKKVKIVKKIHNEGHEIASHSYSHNLIYNMSANEFRNDLQKSISILEDITGVKVKGFRAPSWSVNNHISSWFYEVLEEQGLSYSSSVYPGKTFLYGMPEAPVLIHKPINSSIIEIPQSLLKIGMFKIGFAGGTYLRIFPSWFVRNRIINKNNRGESVFVYLHPWELIFTKYPVKLSLPESFIQYFGIKRNANKLEKVCNKTFKFIKMNQVETEFI